MLAALALAVAATYGAGLGPDGEAPDRSGAALSQSVAGAVLLVGLACVGWWALLRLARGRGLAFTAVVVGLVLVEIGVRIFWWAGEPWLPSTNAAALVTPDGAVLEMYEGWGLVGTGEVTFVRVGQLRAAAVLVAVTAALVLAAVLRDQVSRLRHRRAHGEVGTSASTTAPRTPLT